MGLITYLTRIQFERGAIRLIPEELALLGARRPLIVTDRGVVAAGLVARIVATHASLADAPVFDATPENPTEAAVLAARDLFREHGCDAVLAVGGGSPLDLAKGVALMATHAEPLAQYAAVLGGLPRIRADQPPVLAVPTTAGTGSEVGRAALITLADGRKLGFIAPSLIPNVAICDPDLTLGLPPHLTAATGMDAVTHCIETFLSPRDNPPAEAIALDGLRRAVPALRRAYRDGGDVAAREAMMMAALEGGMTFQKGLGAVHSMSHALGGRKGGDTAKPLHHGTLNAVILPHVLRFNAPACEAKYAALREAMGVSPGADLAAAIEALNRDLGLPRTLAEMSVTAEECEALVPWAVEDHSTATNGRPVGAEDLRGLFAAALRGA
ncbi:iron-containing alcohol dehydrogenase [Methylobacterium oryzisoli]|uniref:iron-containing alcohol dehydrogenase n=1 Tax=Methylobacterium oryzisoli TaxID=3385502 RepID=UPI003892A6BB